MMGVLLGDVVIALALVAAVVVAAATVVVATGVPLEDGGMALTFTEIAAAAAAAAAAMFVGGEVGVCAIAGMAWRELGSYKLCKYSCEFCLVKSELKLTMTTN